MAIRETNQVNASNDTPAKPDEGRKSPEVREAQPVAGVLDVKAAYLDIAKRFPKTIARLGE